ncbi:hypothetical protein GIS00_04895 [Nakamurella sp. YIM 132087]|uniref:Uncharacterized protein n=1 Tax=Nakamurella alba TaxID=2665158 RepID=A0A7K1FGM7_9ACTN|nr:hypothetical protein [Nakamurella alba]MTD13285.1 hypothetical protein [Nakamurella alba]
MSTIALQVVHRPAGDVENVRVFTPPLWAGPDHAYISGPGELNSVCGSCGRTLLRGLRDMHHIPGLLFVCPECRACNAIPGRPPTRRHR